METGARQIRGLGALRREMKLLWIGFSLCRDEVPVTKGQPETAHAAADPPPAGEVELLRS